MSCDLTQNEIDFMIENRVAVLIKHLIDISKAKNADDAMGILINTKTYNYLLSTDSNFYWMSKESIIYRLDEEFAGNVLIVMVDNSDIPKKYLDKIINNHINFVATSIALQAGISQLDALAQFKTSITYRLLQNSESKLYFEVSEYLLCMYNCEIRGDW